MSDEIINRQSTDPQHKLFYELIGYIHASNLDAADAVNVLWNLIYNCVLASENPVDVFEEIKKELIGRHTPESIMEDYNKLKEVNE